MKKILPTLIIFIIACFVINTPRKDQRNFNEIFQEEMNYAEFKTYTDPKLGFSFQYPSFFNNEPCNDGTCNVRFSYHANDINMVLEVKVTYLKSFCGVYKETISSGEVKNYSGYCYHSHSINYKHCCYMLSFYYPQNYKYAVLRIIRHVNKWKPYKHRQNLFS